MLSRNRMGSAAALAAALALGCSRGGGEGTKPAASWIVPVQVPAGVDRNEIFHHNNLGVAHLEQHHYAEAAREFERVVAAVPGWAEGQFNLGVAQLNLHDNPRAAECFGKALVIAPTHPSAHYGLGLIYKTEGKTAEAIAQFRKVLEADPGDPDTLYNLGLLYARDGKHAEAVEALRRTLAARPANVSARFRLASSLLALGNKAEGDREMERFKEMNTSGAGLSMGLQYSEQGRYSLASTDYRAFGEVRPAGGPVKVRFVPVPPAESGVGFRHGGGGGVPLAPAAGRDGREVLCSYGPGLAAADYDRDGDVDLLVTGCGSGGGPPALLRNGGSWRFADATAAAGLAAAKDRVGAAFGDYDNDGAMDLYLTGAGGNLLFHNRGDGTFEDVTAASGVAGGGLSLGPAWADADHDGDLDLVVARLGEGAGAEARPAPMLFFTHTGGGKFRETAAEKKVSSPLSAVGAVFSDLDDDRDIDFLVATASGKPALYLNDRIGTFSEAAAAWGLARPGAGDGATLADLDNDGWIDLVLPRTGWFRNQEGKGFRAEAGLAPIAGAFGSWAVDYDNDADADLVVNGDRLALLANEGSGKFRDISREVGLDRLPAGAGRSMVALDLDNDGDADLAAGINGGPPILLRNDGGNLHSWLEVKLAGLHTNRFGAGTKVEVHTGARFQRKELRLGEGFLSQGAPSLHFGLGSAAQVDFVRLLWPGGVLQSELEVNGGQILEITELDRKGSSCPLIFAWNGRGWRFVTDFLGVGGLGFLMSPGVYAPPDSDEFVKLEAPQLKEREGYYLLQVLENLEEVSYLDQAELWVMDHPEEVSVYPYERFGGSGPPPAERFAFRKPILPRTARDDQGRDVLGELGKIDRTYPDRFPVLERLPGYAEPHTLDLDFGDEIRTRKNLVLFLYGWVDYGYSSTNLAASQAGIAPRAPKLETVGPDGEWTTLVEDMGYPAGLPRMMTVDLRDKVPLPDGRLRITTNLRIYWDQIFLAEVDPSAEPKITKLPVAYADLHSRGYPREHSPDGKLPRLYDYGMMDRTFPFRNMAGNYTRFGAVTELLGEADDRFVIFGRGEELTLKFRAGRLPKLPPGWKRDFLFYARGYCKDMDPNTAFPDTVEPLPFRGMSGYPYPEGEQYPDDPLHVEYLRKFNTRRVAGRP